MAMKKALAVCLALALASLLPLVSCGSLRHDQALVEGLSWDFYHYSCPKLEYIIRKKMISALGDDIGLAPGLIRIFFHDCFVQGCDGSVLLTGSNSEQNSIPNQTLRPKAIQLINDLQDLIEKACGLVVSCADITALAARDSVYLAGGPHFDLPLGRRDGFTPAPDATVLANLPGPSFNVTALLNAFSAKNLDKIDLVALSGAHTVGIGHCPTFFGRLSPPDPTMDPDFAKKLLATCPSASSPNFTNLDVQTPVTFDNKYYGNLLNRRGLFTSDEGLFFDSRTQALVKDFAGNQRLFFERFVVAMVKMSQLDVLTGNKGEIRRNCAVPNSARIIQSVAAV